MLKIPAGEFQRHLGRCMDDALSQPLVITRRTREVLVLLGKDEYDRLKELEDRYQQDTLDTSKRLARQAMNDTE